MNRKYHDVTMSTKTKKIFRKMTVQAEMRGVRKTLNTFVIEPKNTEMLPGTD